MKPSVEFRDDDGRGPPTAGQTRGQCQSSVCGGSGWQVRSREDVVCVLRVHTEYSVHIMYILSTGVRARHDLLEKNG